MIADLVCAPEIEHDPIIKAKRIRERYILLFILLANGRELMYILPIHSGIHVYFQKASQPRLTQTRRETYDNVYTQRRVVFYRREPNKTACTENMAYSFHVCLRFFFVYQVKTTIAV